MIKSIFNFLVGLIKLFFYWRKKADNPANQYEKAKQSNAEMVANGDADSINRKLADGLPLPKGKSDSSG